MRWGWGPNAIKNVDPEPMPLSVGTRVGSYEIVSPLGAGGMGEVYRARDTRLKRDVAIKVLPEQFAADPDRLARFQREAELLASLNHPGIAAVYGLEHTDTGTALVLELVEGPTLADLIGRGAIPIADALKIARQLAEALEAAHDKNVIHRDLKPANVKVRDDGTVKVLDFGLAKLTEIGGQPGTGSHPLSMSPTLTSPATRIGVVLGTAAYMAPEQARGKDVDKRADIWAFGCVLFEMLSGVSTFGGDDVTDTVAFVITREPDWSALPPATPGSIRRLLRRCLEKDRKRRLADIADARLEIEEALSPSTESSITHAAVTTTSPTASARYAWGIAALLLVTSIAAWAWIMFGGRSPEPAPVARLLVSLPEKMSFHLPGVGNVASSFGFNSGSISPDGRTLAFTLVDETGKVVIWIRRLDSLDMRPLPGTEGATTPFWSPDSRVLGFVVEGAVKKVDVAGGPPLTVATLTSATMRGGTWNRDNIIVVAPAAGPLSQVSAAGQPTLVTKLQAGETAHRRPSFLPDGRHFLYLIQGNSPGIAVGSLDSMEAKRLPLSTDGQAIYVPPGYLLFTRQGTLLAQPFDSGRLELTGEPSPVAEQVATDSGNGLSAFSASDTGILTYRRGAVVGSTNASGAAIQLAWFDKGGKELELVGAAAPYRGVDVSRDGTRVAAHRHEGEGGDVWILEHPRGTISRLTADPSQDNASPVWSGDGSRIAFASLRNGSWGIYQKLANSAGPDEELLVETKAMAAPTSYSRDNQWLAYNVVGPNTGGGDIWILPLTGEKKPTAFSATRFAEFQGQISPDGKWLAYQSNELGGRADVFVRPFPTGQGKWTISTGGGVSPRWRDDGKAIYYTQPTPLGTLFSVEVTSSGGIVTPGTPTRLFDARIGPPGGNANVPYQPYAVSSDGPRFLLPKGFETSVASSVPTAVTVVMNWLEDLKNKNRSK